MGMMAIVTICSGQTYTTDSLETMPKMVLTKIYLDKVQQLNTKLPYVSFGAVLDMPMTKYTNSKRKKVNDKCRSYNETIKNELYEIIPYSDKKDIIKGILFLQEVSK